VRVSVVVVNVRWENEAQMPFVKADIIYIGALAANNTRNTTARASKGCGEGRVACEEGDNRLKGGRVSQVMRPGKRSLCDPKEVNRE
jgi:hypothetical protein